MMRARRPPALAAWLLSRCLRPDERAMVLGDLAEEFQQRATSAGGVRAAVWYWQQAARLVWGFWWWNAASRMAAGQCDGVR